VKFTTIQCAKCNGGIDFPNSRAGEWINCPHCGTRLQLALFRQKTLAWWFVVGAAIAVCAGLAFLCVQLGSQVRRDKIRIEQAERDSRTVAGQISTIEKTIAGLRETNAVLLSEMTHQPAPHVMVEASQPPQAAIPVVVPVPTSRIHVYHVNGIVAGYDQCQTDQGTILIAKLPNSVREYWDTVAKLNADISDYSARINEDENAAQRANAVALTGASGDPAYVNAAMQQRAQANLMMENVREAKVKLADLQANLATWRNAEAQRVIIVARPAGKVYAGQSVWNCLSR
jgi:hypothetical protein